MTITLEMLKNSFDMYINSSDRIRGTNTNFVVNFPQQSSILGKQCFISIKDWEISPNSSYIIDGSENWRFYFSVDGVSTISFLIPAGSYTITSILAYIKTQMETLDLLTNTYTFSYLSDQNTVSLTPTYSTGTLELRFALFSDVFKKLLGIDTSSNITVLTGVTYIFPYMCDMLGGDYYYYLNCSLVSNKNISTNGNNPINTIAKVHNHGRFTIQYVRQNGQADYYLFYCPSFQNQFNISLVDKNLKDIVIPNYIEMSMTIRVFPIN